MKKGNGFSMIEVLVAVSITFIMISTLIPIITLLNTEQTALKEQRMITLMLHDELQPYLWEDAVLPATLTKMVHYRSYNFNFKLEQDYIKGCVELDNAHDHEKQICLYGYKKR